MWTTNINTLDQYVNRCKVRYLASLEPSFDRKLNHKCLHVSMNNHDI